MLDELFSLLRARFPHFSVEVVLALDNHAQDFLIISTREGWLSTKKDVEYDTCAPYVTLFVILASEHLRSDVVSGSQDKFHLLLVVVSLRRAEINKLD